MAWTSHGYLIPGTAVERNRPLAVTRCGGPGLCSICSQESANHPRLKERIRPGQEPLRWAEVPVYFDDAYDWPIGRANVQSDGTVTIRIDPVEGAQFIEKAEKGILTGLAIGYAWTEGPVVVETPPELNVTHNFTD